MIDQRQARLVDALQSGRLTGEPMRRIDTHLSHVFLGKERVYKLKRAVRMPFVDFSTPERRRAACEAELQINRRFAPGIYQGVEQVDGDWVVVMRRFPDGALFDEMARAGGLGVEQVAGAAEIIARFHGEADLAPGFGGAGHYQAIAAQLRRTEADGAAAHGLKAGPAGLYGALEAAFAGLSPLIERRRAEGKVRRGHGDLHLRNICLFEGAPTPFDALEFDPALASADVLYDLAFLLMDLRRCGLARHANAAMNRYWDVAGEAEAGLALLPAFMALRAAVRTAVAMEAGKPEEAGLYRRLGLDLLRPDEPRLVAIGGLSGSGKSAVARELAGELGGPCGARLLRTDVIRKAMAGRPETARMPEGAYAPERRAEVYQAMAWRAGEALAAGAPALADATFQDEAARLSIALAAGGARFDAIWLAASREVRLGRVAARAGDASDADVGVAAAQGEPDTLPGWTIVDAEGTLDQVVARVRAVLEAGA